MDEEKEIEKLQKEEEKLWKELGTLSFKQKTNISRLIEINIKLQEFCNR